MNNITNTSVKHGKYLKIKYLAAIPLVNHLSSVSNPSPAISADTHQHEGFDERRDHQQPTELTEFATADELDARHGLQDGAFWIRVCTRESPSLSHITFLVYQRNDAALSPGNFLQ